MSDAAHASAMRAPPCPVDFMAAEFTPNASAGYRAIRAAGPIVAYHPGRGFLLTGYRDTAAALRDPRFAAYDMFDNWPKLERKLDRDYSAVIEFMSYLPFISDGRRHDQLRRALAVAVAPYANGHAAIRKRIDRKLAAAVGDGGFDLVTQFASHLFFDILCDLMEIGEEERSVVKPIATMSRLLESTLPVSYRDRFAEHLGGCIEFLSRHSASAAERGQSGLAAGIYRGLPADEPDPAKTTAMLATIILMMANDATGACISFPVHNLLAGNGPGAPPRVPQSQWADVAEDALRYASPVDVLSRRATEDADVAGCVVRKGELLILSLMCANHDPAEFGELADVVTIKPGRPIGIPFGAGIHVCVGNRLSRIIVGQAFDALARLPQMRIAGDPIYGVGKIVRTIASQPVEFA